MNAVHRRQRAHRQHGFTLVELMVGLTLGLFISLAAISVFVSTRVLHTISSADSRRGENARLAMDLLHKDFRSASFQGCHSQLASLPVSVLNAGNGLFLDVGTSGVAGSRGTGTAFLPALNAALVTAAPTAPLPTSDVVSIRVPVEPMSLGLAAPMTATTGAPGVGAATVGNGIASGDIVLIANCKAAAMFQVTEANPATTGVLTHAVGGTGPGNATADLGYVFRGDSAVYRLQTHHYYVANSVLRPGTTSMWRLIVPNGGPPQEVVQGVDRLRVRYGVDTDSDRTLNRYDTADAVADWNAVVAVRVQLLTATTKDNVAMGTQSVAFDGATFTPTDRRLRTALTEVIALRSRAP